MTPVFVAGGVIGAAALGWLAVRGRPAAKGAPAEIAAELRLYTSADQPADERVWVITAGGKPAVVQIAQAALEAESWSRVGSDPMLRVLVAGAAQTRVRKATLDEAAVELRALLLAQFDPAVWGGAELLFYVRVPIEVIAIDQYAEDVRKSSGWWTAKLTTPDGIKNPQGETLDDLLGSWFDKIFADATMLGWGQR